LEKKVEKGCLIAVVWLWGELNGDEMGDRKREKGMNE